MRIRLHVTITLSLLLSGCSLIRSSGLLNMDDYWCNRHPNAPVYRCPPPPPPEYRRP
jgi:hypothetical protein